MTDLVILFSGGADSTLLLKIAEKINRKPLALMIDYNQLHIQELEFAKRYCEKNKIENMTIKIDGYDVNSALTGNGEKGIYQGVNIHNVPQRNSIFLTLAAGIAESKNITEIWFGANWQDFELDFPDCLQPYIGKMNELLKISGAKPITVYAPLLGMSKELIKEMLKLYSINSNDIFSGYGEFE
jgi:queuosine biosynthesis protein QueC